MSGIKVTRENPATPLPTALEAPGDVSGEDVDWPTGPDTPLPLDGLSDVDAPTPMDGDVLTWDDYAMEWVAAPAGAGTAVEILDEGTPLTATVASIDFVGSGVTASTIGDAVTVTIPGGSLPWFNVIDYGAVGDGSADDTSAINSAIAALNSAGQGVLYFPAAVAYKITSALTTISAVATIQGDGGAGDPVYSSPVSQIRQTSATANAFTISGSGATIRDLSIRNTNGGTPSAGAGISIGNAYWARIERVTVSRFYDTISIDDGAGWSLNDCFIFDPVRYGIRIRGTISPDNGDQSIVGCYFLSDTHAGTSAIRQESAGGLKIANTKVNARSSSRFVTGYDGAFSVATAVLTITGSSFENVSGDAISIATTSPGYFGLVAITGCEVGLYTNNSGRAVKITADVNGALATAGSISAVVLDGLVLYTNGTARAAIELVKTDRVTLGDIQLEGFNARYTSTSDTNTTDGSGVAFATPAIVLGTAAAAGAASTVIRSDSTIVAFDATVPVTQAFSDAAATGSAAVAARRDHVHGMPAASGTSALDAYIWRPLMDGAGNVITDGTGQAVMAYSAA